MIASNIAEFNGAVNAWAARHATGLSMDVIIRKLTLDALLGTTNYTPVDTGYARFNWQVGVGHAPKEAVGVQGAEYPELQPEVVGSGAVVAKVPTKGTIPKFGVVFVANNAEYIEYVNDGSPTIRAHKMVERTQADLLAEIEKTTVDIRK